MAIVILLIFVFLCVAALWQGLTVRRYIEQTHKVSAPVRLALQADLHSVFYGKGQRRLVKVLRKQKPDAVLFAGDIVEEIAPRDGAKQLFSLIGREFPCYYVMGNHEFRTGKMDVIKEMAKSFGVTVLAGEAKHLTVRGQKLLICGVDDPECFGIAPYEPYESPEGWKAQLSACAAEAGDDVYTLLLSHRPEPVEQYKNRGFDLVLAGHAHGGQMRIPWVLPGLFAPNQGWFPKYTAGRYALGSAVMIVSRGLCRNRLPRIFNPPELVIVDLLPPL